MRIWIRAHRSLLAALTSTTVIAALVATVAIVSGGYTAQRLNLGDAAVWVTNETRQSVGRANTAVMELNTVVAAGSSSLDVVQQDATVLIVDRGNSALDIVDPANADIAGSVPLPPDSPTVLLSGDRAVVESQGDVWSVPTGELERFDALSAPTVSFGAGTVVSLDESGLLTAFTPGTGDLMQFDTHAGTAVGSTVSLGTTPPRNQGTGAVNGADAGVGAADDAYQLASVAGHWALLNATTGHLFLTGRDEDLNGVGPADLVNPVLQQTSVVGDRVLVAADSGLLAVPLAGGSPEYLVTGRNSPAAAPASVGSCSYAAWADGTAWRDCGGAGSERQTGSAPTSGEVTLEGVAASARMEFRVNGTGVVLNDAHNGAAWAVQRGNELIDNWADLIDTVQTEQQVEDNTQDTPPTFEQTQVAPVAVDDVFGARPGRATVLPLLLNDYDANDDVLMISELDPLPAAQGRLELIADNQQVQLTLPGDAAATSGPIVFGYSITDGRGGTASATVTVTVRRDDENSPPVQVRATRATAEASGQVTSQTLGDWMDPDGDPFYLASATTSEPDHVGFTPAGAVTFTDSGTGAASSIAGNDERREVALSVSDGRGLGTGTLSVFVRAAGTVPILTDSFSVLATAGAEVTVLPLEHARGGSGVLRLSSVPAKPNVTITPNWDDGSFRFSSDEVGTHYLEYAVTDGAQSATGQVRIEVAAAADVDSRPVTVPHTAFIRGSQPSLVDVLATDFDPAGGVLLVTGVTVPVQSGLRVEILEQRLLRVTLTEPLATGSVSFGYRVSNGLFETDGSVTVIELPAVSQKQAPRALPDTASVRVGDAIDIPVLANDEHPDGDPLTLDPVLTTGLKPGAGLLFAAGNTLRYLAPATAGNYTAVYRVTAPDGQFANAEVRILVREADAATNNAPKPETVTARVLAGGTVRIPIPLNGIDPDGDSVQLLGQETNPEKGAVTGNDSDSFEYVAGAYSAGTDSFTYSVVDALGARATGTVRVGISARLDGARNPIAAPDEVVVRPGRTVSVQVLGNDSDPDGGALSLVSVAPSNPGIDSGSAVISDLVVDVTAPQAEGRYGYIYEIQNERGGTSSNFLTVVVSKDAPRSVPIARDTRLTLGDILDRSTVDVDVLAQVFFADGPSTDLTLAVLPGYTDTARVTTNQHITVTVQDRSQIIPFSVTHPDDAGIVSFAFLWVPGFRDALPQVRASAPALTVASESTLVVDLNDYVVAVGGKTVRLTDTGTVRATHADGAPLATSDTRLAFTSADQYYGPASISFEVTDGTSASDPEGRKNTIVLPITVTPRDNQPPTFDGAVIDFEPEQTKVIDLTKLTSYPYPADVDELVFTVLDPQPTGFTWSLNGHVLSLTAQNSTLKGTSSPITIGVRDSLAQGQAGRIDMRVVASTRPRAIPATDAAIAPRGQTTVVDVLANDEAANPFPTVPLRVVAVRGLDGGTVPAGVTITPSADSSRLSIRVSQDAAPVDTNLQYQVADATGDPDRYAWGTVRISVQDVPAPVTNLTVGGFGDGSLAVAFNAGAANNSAITGYEITLRDAGTSAVVGTSVCEATSCEVSTSGNGRGNAVRVSVVAQNAIGSADATTLRGTVWSDVVPAAPTGLASRPLDGGLHISWAVVASGGGGTAVRGYVVTANGQAQTEVSANGAACSAGRCSLDVFGLTNGANVTYTVSARNDALPELSSWAVSRSDGTPYGAPVAGGISASGSDANGSVTVSWTAFADSGDPILGYYAQQLDRNQTPTGPQACSVLSPAPGLVVAPAPGGIVSAQQNTTATSATFENLGSTNGRYSFVVWGYNRAGCVATDVESASLRVDPATAPIVQGSMGWRGDAWDYQITNVSAVPGADRFELKATGAADPGLAFAGTGWPRELLGVAFGSAVSVQVRGCNQWGGCGPWSAPATAAEASVSLAVGGVVYDPTLGHFSWTSDPANNGLAVSYTCEVRDTVVAATAADSPSSCTLPDAPPAGTVRLTASVDTGVNTHSYDYDK
ncbi:Ig-like domain-containing protein [Cryobacterium sp. MLB-32]|uniref:Ig-like domain-containing protein n=1 Tax=Cryobacterium sp. MLB-32 TaxID=1529318 RepID=UPI0006903168|nr:Ig-like domain-containing protein [Cryobacterium sp. MLB-32]